MTHRPDELARMYRQRFPEADREAKARIWNVLVPRIFQPWIRPDDTVLDLGCGYGEFLNAVRCRRRIGFDLNPDSATHLAQGIELHAHPVTDLSAIASGSVNVVFTSNLMEHLPGKAAVEQMLREVHRVLARGGLFIALGPNLRFLPGLYWDFWDHVVPITDRSLVEVLENLDFEIVEAIPRFLPYTTRSSLPQAPWLVSLYLRLRPIWPLFGQQFLIRARRGTGGVKT